MPAADGLRAVVGGEVVARADGREQPVRINSLQARGARGDMPVERDEERFERSRDAR